jgi:hypothetical protein
MSFARECLLFVLLLIAALLSAVLRLAQLVSVPKRPRRQEAKSNSAQATRSAKLSAVNGCFSLNAPSNAHQSRQKS